MTDDQPLPPRVRDLIDDYLDGTLDNAGLKELEADLESNAAIREYFARYVGTHVDLGFELAARAATDRTLVQLRSTSESRPPRRLVAASLAIGLVAGGVVGLFAAPARSDAPAAIARSLALDFRTPRAGTLADAEGRGTGFTQRLPDTGGGLQSNDANLRLVPGGGLAVTATNSDLNTRFRLDQGEFPGVRLSDLGFTGVEDFEVAFTAAVIPALGFVGQFGVYAGVGSDWTVRGGLVSERKPDSFRQFVVNTRDGRDKDTLFIGLGSPGDNLRMALSRIAGKYTVAVENRTSGATTTLATRHPEFLEGRADLVVGLYAADPRGKEPTAFTFSGFTATVWVPGEKRR